MSDPFERGKHDEPETSHRGQHRRGRAIRARDLAWQRERERREKFWERVQQLRQPA